MNRSLLALLVATVAACAEEPNSDSKSKPLMETSETTPTQPTSPVSKTDAEWSEELTAEQFRILRKAGTEPSNGKAYKEFKGQGAGTYYCAGCDAELFSSNEKFDSGCGWPSFYDPSKAKNVKTSTDYKLGYPRTEVICAVCEGHLGHVFSGEGYDTPTDQRYCINGTVLKFVPANTGKKKVEPDATTAPEEKKP